MNLRQSYEHLIAHKLRKLPAPDAEASWQQMKRLLDEDEDTRAGGKRNPGNGGGWWRIGIIAIILSASGWLYLNHATSPVKDIAKNKTSTSNNNQPSTIDKNTTPATSNPGMKASKNGNAVAAPKTTAVTAADQKTDDLSNSSSTNKSEKSVAADNTLTAAAGVNSTMAAGVKPGANEISPANESQQMLAGITPAKTRRHSARLDASINNNELIKRIHAGDDAKYRSGTYANTTGTSTNDAIVRRYHDKTTYGSKSTEPANQNGSVGSTWLPVNQSNATNIDWLATLSDLNHHTTIPALNTDLALGDSIQNSRNTAVLLNAETKKSIAKAQRDKDLEDMTRKEHKRFHLDLSNAFKPFSLHMDAEPRWAAGIALNNGITLGAQDRFNYSMNAKSGVLTDYIPSLYLQFHLNDYVFAQTELNFVSPQYTPQLMVFRQNNDVTAQAGISQQKSVFIQKLYYFSVPVSLHYSPINNLYFSAGLQFSSFQSGLATIQEKQYSTSSGPDHPNSISNTVLKFKDDSIAAKLAPNEWRWQAGAEYYFNRFTVGLRYNRSFKNLVTADAAATVPAAAGLHNQSMILFMRYNLFESRKKKANAE